MQNEIEITEQDLEQLRELATAPRSYPFTAIEDEAMNINVLNVVLARAGRATPPGRYRLIGGEWKCRLETIKSEWDGRSDLDRMLDDAGFPVVSDKPSKRP